MLGDSLSDYVSKATAALMDQRVVDAEQICRYGLMANKWNTPLLNLLGQSLIGQGRYSEAADVFSESLQIEPKNPIAHFLCGVARQAEGKLEEALQYLEKASQLAPNLPEPLAKIGQIRCLQGRMSDAIPPLRRALVLNNDMAPARLYLAVALSDVGDLDEAERVLDQAMEASPMDPELLQARGRLLMRRGQFDEAVTAFTQTTELVPDLPAPYVAITYSRKTKANDEAFIGRMINLLGKPDTADEDRALLSFAIGKSYEDLRRYEEAITYFDQANRISLEIRRKNKIDFDRAAYSENLDALLRFCGEDVALQKSGGSASRNDPIFILGMGRSGTSLVEQILGSHPDVKVGGELSYWLDSIDSQRSLGGKTLSEKTARDLGYGYLAMLGELRSDRMHITDKAPANYLVLGAILRAFPSARIVHCRRNPVDTCISIFTTPFLRAPDFAHDRGNIVFAYREYLRMMEAWRSRFPGANILELDYERLVGEKEESTRRLVAFLGLPWNDLCLHSERSLQSVHTPSQWQVRQPIYRSSVDRWRSYEPWLGAFKELLAAEPVATPSPAVVV